MLLSANNSTFHVTRFKAGGFKPWLNKSKKGVCVGGGGGYLIKKKKNTILKLVLNL